MNPISKLRNFSPLVLLISSPIYILGYFTTFLSSAFIGGWDGDGHFAMMLKYSRDIFPNIFGWNAQTDLGMPWPVGYPPLSNVIFAIWERILPWEPQNEFKLLFILLTILTPVLVYFLARQLGFRIPTALLSGFLMMFFLASTASTEFVGGITLRATFGFGLYPQFVAFVFLLGWLIFFLKAGWHNQLLSGVLFAAVVLSNIHVAICAVVLWICIVATKLWINRKESFWPNLFSATGFVLLVILLTAFWLLPLIRNYAYFLSLTQFNLEPGVILPNYWPYWLVLLIGTGIAVVKRFYSIAAVGISAVILLLLSILPIYRILPILPLQPDRILPIAMVLSLFMLPVIVEQIGKLKHQAAVSVVIVIAIFIVTPLPQKGVGGVFKLTEEEAAMTDFVKQFNDGRSLVEAWYDRVPDPDPVHALGQPTHNIIAARLVEQSSHETLISIFRESSFSSPFTQPVRNTFSAVHHDAYGVACWLCDFIHNTAGEFMFEYNSLPLSRKLEQAKLFGIKYFLLRSQQMQGLFKANSEVELLKSFGNWQVFALKGETPKVVSLSRNPVLTFTNLASRERPVDGHDWLRLNEEWLFHGGYEHVLAKNQVNEIDLAPELDDFNSVLISDYKYQNIEAAYQRLLDVSKRGILLLLSSPADPLYQRLTASGANPENHIFIIPRTSNVRVDMGTVLDILDQHNPRLNTVQVALEQNAREIKVSGEAKFVLVKNSYFPEWKSTNSKLYLASPSLMLVDKNQNEAVLKYSL